MTKKLIIALFFLLSAAATGRAQSPPVPMQATVYANITSTSRLDGCYSGYPCIDNRSQSTRRNSYHAFRVFGSGTWSVTMKWADTTPTGFVSYGSTAVVTNASPSSAIGYGLDPASITKGYHDYIIFEITGSATIENYFGTKSAWWSPSVAGISYPLTYNQGGTGTPYQTIVYPEAYGAVPGNVIDSGTAFNAALAAAGALPNGAIWCQGSYNMGTTNLTLDTAQGVSIFSPSPGGCRLNWTSGATGNAVNVGNSSQTTYLVKLEGVRLITASTSQGLIKATRTHELKLYNLEMEGPGNATDTNDCITLESVGNDSIFTDVLSVNCNHVKRGLVVLSTGSGNKTTTWNSNGFKVFGPGPQGTKRAGSVGVDFGASGNGDGFTFTGGNFENLEYGVTSSGGAGASMHGLELNGVRFEDVTYGFNVEQFSFDNKMIGNGGLLTYSGAGRCANGNVSLANSGVTSGSPLPNCLTSTLNINPGLNTVSNTPQTAINMTIPNQSTFPIERNALDSGGIVPFQKNAAGMLSSVGGSPTLWAAVNGDPNSILGPPVASATYTSGGTISGASGSTCLLKFTGGTLGGISLVTLTGANTIAGGTAITILDGGYGYSGSAPTAATLVNGIEGYPSPTTKAATCSGSIVVASTLGTVGGHLVTNLSGGADATLYVGNGTANKYLAVPGYNQTTNVWQWPSPPAGTLVKMLGTSTTAGTGGWVLQPGGGSAAFGGSSFMYEAAAAGKPGDAGLGCGSSTAKIRFNNSGIDNGSDLFLVDCATGQMRVPVGTSFANLGSTGKSFGYCNDCNVATPCTGGGAGAWYFRKAAGSWTCPY